MATDPSGQFNSLAIAAEVGGKRVSVVCVTCKHYWHARDKQIPGTGCLGPRGCGSPMAGDNFHGYDGPVPRERLGDRCFRCGAPASYAMRVLGKAGYIGVCHDDLDFVVRTEPVLPPGVLATLPDRVIVLGYNGRQYSLRELRDLPRKQTFWEFVDEVEEHAATSPKKRSLAKRGPS